MLSLKCNVSLMLLLSLFVVGCDPISDPESEFKFSEDLTLKTGFIYDAESKEIIIDHLLSDAVTMEPYNLVTDDKPITASWYETEIELVRVDIGRLNGKLELSEHILGDLEISTKLLSSVLPEESILNITDVPSMLENSYQDTEVIQLYWSPTSKPTIDSDYLESKTIEVILRSLRCGENQTDFIPEKMKLAANSVYTSDRTIATTVSYQSVLELLRNSSVPTGEQCDLDLSFLSTQELAMQPSEMVNDSSSIAIRISDNFANTVSDTHTFTFYSKAATLQLNL